MKKLLLFVCVILLGLETVSAQDKRPAPPHGWDNERRDAKETTREYSIIVYERQSDAPLSLDREIANGRGIGDRIFDLYRSTFAGKVTNLSSTIMGIGVDALVKLVTKNRDNKAKWQATIQKEMTYSRNLPMQTEIADFYKSTSSIGAMDPNGMMFNGFGCRQYLTYRDKENSLKRILVFEIACSLDESTIGKQRIVHHGKFVLKVDSVRFNPYLCNLPNDSLSMRQVEEALRIPFDFERRKNLTFRLTADITSSWMNEAIEIFKDQSLGQFQVEFTISDSTVLEQDGPWKGYYSYNASSLADQQNPKKNVRITGESFIVPRSFVGNYTDGETQVPSTTPLWGTGQYRIDMQIMETCQMNEQYYSSGDMWKDEWKIIKRRKKSPSFFQQIVEQTKKEFDIADHKWVVTILEPFKSAIIVDESKWVNRIITGQEGVAATQSNQRPSTGDHSNPAGGGQQQNGGQSKNGGHPIQSQPL